MEIACKSTEQLLTVCIAPVGNAAVVIVEVLAVPPINISIIVISTVTMTVSTLLIIVAIGIIDDVLLMPVAICMAIVLELDITGTGISDDESPPCVPVALTTVARPPRHAERRCKSFVMLTMLFDKAGQVSGCLESTKPEERGFYTRYKPV